MPRPRRLRHAHHDRNAGPSRPTPNLTCCKVPTEAANASKYFDAVFDAHHYTKHIARHTPGGKHHWFSDGYHVDGQTNNELNAYMVRDLWGDPPAGGGRGRGARGGTAVGS